MVYKNLSIVSNIRITSRPRCNFGNPHSRASVNDFLAFHMSLQQATFNFSPLWRFPFDGSPVEARVCDSLRARTAEDGLPQKQPSTRCWRTCIGKVLLAYFDGNNGIAVECRSPLFPTISIRGLTSETINMTNV